MNLVDYSVWRDHVGSVDTLPNVIHSGIVGSQEYGTWKAAFGNTANEQREFGLASVPEPSACKTTCILLVVALLGAHRQIRPSTET